MILRIVEAKVCGDFCVRVAFNDGTSKVVNLMRFLRGRFLNRCGSKIFLRV